MSIFLSLFRVTKFAIQNFFRNFWLSLITITIFVLTLFTINAVIFINIMADTTLQSLEEKVEVSVYFTTEASEDLVKSVQGYLLSLSQVRTVEFISAEDGLKKFKEEYAENPLILSSLEEVDGNPVGHSLIITAISTDDFPFIVEALDTPEYSSFIKEKDYTDYESIIEKINALKKRIKYGGFILASFFSLIAVLIVFNTIRIAIYVYREEIGIMKLVGANDWFVRAPFLIESFFYSFISVGIVVGIISFSLKFLEPWFERFFIGTDVSLIQYFTENGLIIFGGQFVVLLLLSVLTTMFAIRKYLRV